MKILHLNASDLFGGAACAAYRIHKGLREIGMDSKMLVQSKISDDKTVVGPENKLKKGFALFRPILDSTINKVFAGGPKNEFSPAWIPFSSIPYQVQSIAPDIVNLHWICAGMMRIEDLKRISKPIVWTLHDMWPFTGGCHYSNSCFRFQENCGRCPQLNGGNKNDFSQSILNQKKRAWRDLDITIVTPSKWLAECAKKSNLFKDRRIEVIHNGLDLNQSKPIDKTIAREIWNLPINKKLILFGAISATSEHRKGFDLLHKSLKHLATNCSSKAELVVFGASEPNNPLDFNLPVHYMGHLHDDVSLALLYAASDVMLTPSRQDNLPNTIAESLALGTPVVAFNIGGMPDMIDHQINGYLANPFDISDLAAGIKWILSNENRYKELCLKAREKAINCFNIKKVAKKYAKLYRSIV